MSDRYSGQPGYQGLPKEYQPELGEVTPGGSVPEGGVSYSGYHDMDLLKSLLAIIKSETGATITQCQSKLESYNLQTLTPALQEAQKTDWPTALGDPKDYISYHQYDAFREVDTRGSKYLRKAYEDTIRGPAGTCALDILIICEQIQAEANRIGDFLDGYIGTVDDTAEYRILEAFQDWAYVAIKYERIFRGILDSKNEDAARIPEQDITRLSKDEAKSFQTLFKTKLNGFNDEVVRTLDDIKKEFAFQDHFYDKILGPGLSFRLKVGTSLNQSMVGGFFGNQADAAYKMFHEHLQAGIADQIKRNDMFEKKFNELEVRLKARNAYTAYINQLAQQGAPLRIPFIDTPVSQEERDQFAAYKEEKKTETANKNKFRSSHYDLSDLDVDDAHPQYVLKSGDTVTGDIDADVGVKFDQVDVDEHRHKGKDVDNTWQIDGDDLLKGTLPSNVVNNDEPVCTPVNLRLLTVDTRVIPPGVTSVTSQIAWNTCNPKLMYEVELVPFPEPVEPWWVDSIVDFEV